MSAADLELTSWKNRQTRRRSPVVVFFSLRWKLTISYVLLAISTASAVGILSYVLIKRYVDRKTQEALQATAAAIETQIKPRLLSRDHVELQLIAETYGLINDVRIRILDTRRQLLVDSHPEGLLNFSSFRFIDEKYREMFEENKEQFRIVVPRVSSRNQFQQRPPRRMELQLLDADSHLSVRDPESRADSFTFPIRGDREVLGYIELQNPQNLAGTTVKRAQTFLLIAALIAVATSVMIGLLMGTKLASPLLRLRETVMAMNKDNLSTRAVVDRRDEIGQLANQINNLARRLEQSFMNLARERDSLKVFAEDASHELRTPVTALLTFNELLLGSIGDRPETRKEFLLDSKHQLERLKWIVQELLNLTRLDANLLILELEEVHVDDLIEDLIRSFSGRIEEKKLRVKRRIADGSEIVRCDRARFYHAVSNIFENAITYSDDGGFIIIATEVLEDRWISISITDHGPGMSDTTKKMVFGRFYRAPDARGDGSGLGLALAQSIVRAHGGDISVEDETHQGSCFRIKLPHSLSTNAQ